MPEVAFTNEQIDTVIRLVAYLGMVGGLLVVLYPFFLNRKKAYSRFKSLDSSKKAKSTPDALLEVEKDLEVIFGQKNDKYISLFVIVSTFLFILPFMVLYNTAIQVHIALAVSAVLSITPYVLIKIKLHSVRVDASYEGSGLIVELSNQYTINHLNMSEAVHKTIKFLPDNSRTKKSLTNLSLKLDKVSSSEELEKVVDDFVYSINTSWATSLGNNIYMAIDNGDNVSLALDDIIDELKALNEIHEKSKEGNFESYFLTWIVPLGYVGSVFFLFRSMDFTVERFVQHQFVDDMGLKLFIGLGVLTFINIGLFLATRKPMNDFD